jgi:hypothetical protein
MMEIQWWDKLLSPQILLRTLSKYIWITLTRPIYPDCLLAHCRTYPHVSTANRNTVKDPSLWRVSTTTSCQMTVQWTFSLVISVFYTVLLSVVKGLYGFDLIIITKTRCYYFYYGPCFKHDYPKYFLKSKRKYSKNKTYLRFFIQRRNSYSLGYYTQ